MRGTSPRRERARCVGSSRFCSAGSWGSASTIRCGTRRPLARTGSACSRARWPRVFSPRWSNRRAQGLLSDEHFTVDGTLIEAWAGHKSFKTRDAAEEKPPHDDLPGNPSVDFHGERRSNDTHQSTTDPEARLARKGAGKEARLSFAGHVLMDNREGLAVDGCVTQATGRAEPEEALAMVEQIPGWRPITLGADKGYDR